MALIMWPRLIKTPIVLQGADTECGITALAILFKYYGCAVGLEQLRARCASTRDGTSAATLVNLAKDYGFEAAGYKLEPTELMTLTQPVIAFWNFNHYVVINKVYKQKVHINDPASGARWISMDQFDTSFTGVVLVLTPVNIAARSRVTSFAWLQNIGAWLAKGYRGIIFLLACVIVTVILSAFNAAATDLFISRVLLANDLRWVGYIIMAVVIFSCLSLSIVVIQQWQEYKLKAYICLAKLAEIIDSVMKLPMIFYALRQKSELVAIINSADSVINLLSHAVIAIVVAVVALVTVLTGMLFMNVRLSSIFLILLAVTISVGAWLAKEKLAADKQVADNYNKLYSLLVSCIKQAETVKACALEDKIAKDILGQYISKSERQDYSSTLALASEAIEHLVQLVFIVIVLGVGSVQMATGEMSLGSIMAYYGIGLFFIGQIKALLQNVMQVQAAYAKQSRINELLTHAIDDRYAASETINLDQTQAPAIYCRQVDFYYNQQQAPSLAAIQLHIDAGQHVALVGHTGSGKSTLAKILAGFFTPMAGEIRLFGMDITKIHPQVLANHVAYVAQEAHVFSTSLLHNLTLWRSCDQEKISAALAICCLEHMAVSDLASCQVSENAENFSGGEIQRLQLASALLQDTAILILDEPTAALDLNTEAKLITNLRRLNKTIIFVAHRLSTVQHCDQILVMQQGKIIEAGDHQTLRAKRGAYFYLEQGQQVP